VLINFTGGADMSLHELEEAARIVQEAAHDEANIILGAVVDPNLQDEIRMTVIATGFTEKREASLPGKVVDLPRAARPATVAGAGGWRRRTAEPRAESDDVDLDDLDVPAFLRRQAD
jgi:cell division protein FtsZ